MRTLIDLLYRRRDRQRSVLCHTGTDVTSSSKNSGWIEPNASTANLSARHSSAVAGDELEPTMPSGTNRSSAAAQHPKAVSCPSNPGIHDLRSRHHHPHQAPQSYLLPSSVHHLPKTGGAHVSCNSGDCGYACDSAQPHTAPVAHRPETSSYTAHLRHHPHINSESQPSRPTADSSSSSSLDLAAVPLDAAYSPQSCRSLIEQIAACGNQLTSFRSTGSGFAAPVLDIRLPPCSFQPDSVVSDLLEQSSVVRTTADFGSPSPVSYCPRLMTGSQSRDESRNSGTICGGPSTNSLATPSSSSCSSAGLLYAPTTSDQAHSIFTTAMHANHFVMLNPQSSMTSTHTRYAKSGGASFDARPLVDASGSHGPPSRRHVHPQQQQQQPQHSISTETSSSGRGSVACARSIGLAAVGVGRHGSPHINGINHRIAQLVQHPDDRSMQLVLLQDINQILLMGFEENLVNLNVHGLVHCILDILDSAEEHLVELKNLGCNVLTHMMDVLPRSSDAIVPALPLLLTTMSSSFVGDILERVINLLEQLSRRHGKEVLQSGGVAAVLGFYDFVTLAQHRTILTMVANCFVNLQTADFELIADSLPSLVERLKESDPRCVDRVCTCFARLVSAYRSEPGLLKRIVAGCDLFANLQHLLMASPPILSTVRDVVHMLAVLCSSCPSLAVNLIKQNIAVTLHCILTGKAVNSNQQMDLLLMPLGAGYTVPASATALVCGTTNGKRCRSHSGSDRKRSVASKRSPPGKSDVHLPSPIASPMWSWPPLWLTASPMSADVCCPASLVMNKRGQDEEIHAIVQLICELLPPVPATFTTSLFTTNPLQGSTLDQSADPSLSGSPAANSQAPTVDGPRATRNPPRRSESEHIAGNRRSESYLSNRLSVPLNHLVIEDKKEGPSSSPDSSGSSATLKCDPSNSKDAPDQDDPRANLLQSECLELHRRLEALSHSTSNETTRRRRSSLRYHRPGDPCPGTTSSSDVVRSDPGSSQSIHEPALEALQSVQTLLPLLFEIFTETTRLQTRLKCLEAIQRMLYYSSPILLSKTLRPRVVCNHLVGMLNCPEKRIILAGLSVALLLISRIPPMFITYFRKEGILHRVNSIQLSVANQICPDSKTAACPLSTANGSVSKATASHRQSSSVATKSGSEPHCSTSHLSRNASCSPDCAHPVTSLQQLTQSNRSAGHLTGSSDCLVGQLNRSAGTTKANGRRGCGTTSTASVLRVEDSAPSDDQTLCHWIDNACHQLIFYVDSLVRLARNPSSSSSSLLASSSTELCSLPVPEACDESTESSSPMFRIDDMSLTSHLASIAAQLTSNTPTLWILAFQQLIGLLQPSKSNASAEPAEPPSPFELQSSGVTTALLHYLTENDLREIRMWIFYRLFFGKHTCPTSRLSTTHNLPCGDKKHNLSKSLPTFYGLSPVLVDSTQLDSLREIDRFVDKHIAASGTDGPPDGPAAFDTLVNCLLACFHRHEHFQVVGLPSGLTADCKIYPLLYACLANVDSDKGEATQLASHGLEIPSRRPSDRASPPPAPPTSSQVINRNRHNHRTSHRSSAKANSIGELCSDFSTLPGSTTTTTVECYPDATDLGRQPVLPGPSASMAAYPPVPGLVSLELVRLRPDEQEQADSMGGGTSPKPCGLRVTSASGGGHSTKAFHKTSASSSPSSVNSSTSGTTIDSLCLPERFCLQTTALATFQIIERILLQRNYINTLINDGLWPGDHEYALSSLAEACAQIGPGDEGSSDLFEGTRIHIADPIGGSNHKGSSHRRSSECLRDSFTVKRSHFTTRSHRGPKPDGVSVNPTARLSSDYTSSSSAVQADSVGCATSSTSRGLHRSPAAIRPESSGSGSGLGVVEPPIRESASGPNRGLRVVLQRSPEMPGSGPSVTVSSDAASIGGCDVLTSARVRGKVDKPGESWSLRHRPGTKMTEDSKSDHAVDRVPTPRADQTQHRRSSRGPDHASTGLAGTGSTNSPRKSNTVAQYATTTELTDPTRVSQHNPQTSSRVGVSSRRRRLKGNSILAAFGALASLSPPVFDSSAVDIRQSSKHVKTGCTASTSSQSLRFGIAKSEAKFAAAAAAASLSPSASSSSSMSPVSMDGSSQHCGKRRSQIVFYIGGHRLPSDLPIYEAIRKFSPELNRLIASTQSDNTHPDHTVSPDSSLTTGGEQDELSAHLMWYIPHVIHYQWVTNTAPGESAESTLGAKKSSFSSLYRPKLGSNHPAPQAQPPPQKSTRPHLSTGISSAMTCLKRRRSDELIEHMQIDPSVEKSDRIPARSAHATSPQQTNHPLFASLTRELPHGLSNDTRCCCRESECPSMSTALIPHSRTTPPAPIIVNETVTTTLALLRALHNLGRLWYTFYDTFDPAPIVSPLAFRSPKLALKAGRQLQDAFNILAGNLPSWLTQLVSTCPFLFPFEIRRSFFYAYNFDRDRTLLRLQDVSSNSLTEIEQLVSSHSRNSALATLNDPSFAAGTSPVSIGSTAGSDLSTTSRISSIASGSWTLTVPHADSGQLTSILSSTATTHPPPPPPPPPPHRSEGHLQSSRHRLHTRLALTPNIRRHKVTVARDGKRMLKQAESTMADMLDSSAVLEIAFEGEVGFGLGPTLEFYTLVSRQLMKSSLGLWHGSDATAEGYHIAPSPGLYPRPLPRHARSSVVREVRSKFLFLGRLMARVLLDWRQLDLPFSPAFFKWFLADTPQQAISHGHILPNDLGLVDPELGRHMLELTQYANRRALLCRQLEQQLTTTRGDRAGGGAAATVAAAAPCKSGTSARSHHPVGSSALVRVQTQRELEELKESIAAIDQEVGDLCLTFVLPGYEIELVKNGAHLSVTGANLDEYIRLVAHWLVIEGASRQMEAVLEGFDSVLPNARQRLALIFQPDEMEGLFCGRSASHFESMWTSNPSDDRHAIHSGGDGWDPHSLTEACRCDHGYTMQSRTIRNLFEILSEFDQEQRRLFVQFVTGSPRLPVGGFRALKPPLKIVMKKESGDNADFHLPSVMTCQNYLKLPDYSSKELLLSKLLYAISEGQNAFHLS